MYMNSGYIHDALTNVKDKSHPLSIRSCGNYRLDTQPKLPTYRPKGRLDYQIIYVTSGVGHFHFDTVENETIVAAGNMVLFRPKELQKYEYYGADKPEVYWIHFTGYDVKNILRRYGLRDNQRVFRVGTSLEYERIFKQIILELQRCQPDYEELLSLLFRQLLITIHREITSERVQKNEYMEHEMELAASYFNENYHQPISIEAYATSRGMSISWFIRSFRTHFGSTPLQFLTSLRITNAQILLETTNYSVNEIAEIVGYDNPLYFSRLFHKQRGCSPSQYRKQCSGLS